MNLYHLKIQRRMFHSFSSGFWKLQSTLLSVLAVHGVAKIWRLNHFLRKGVCFFWLKMTACVWFIYFKCLKCFMVHHTLPNKLADIFCCLKYIYHNSDIRPGIWGWFTFHLCNISFYIDVREIKKGLNLCLWEPVVHFGLLYAVILKGLIKS